MRTRILAGLTCVAAMAAMAPAARAGVVMSWDFNDNTTQGWFSSQSGTPTIEGAPGDYWYTIVGNQFTNEVNAATVNIPGGYTVASLTDTISFDYDAWMYQSQSLNFATNHGTLSVALDPTYDVWWDAKATPKVVAFSVFSGLNVGDVISSIEISAYAPGHYGPHSLSVDNIAISSVPEPTSMTLLGLGGGLALLRRRMSVRC